MTQKNIIKEVVKSKSGSGSLYGRIYLPKEYIGKLVLIVPLNKTEEKAYMKNEMEYLKSIKEREERLKMTHTKLRALREDRQERLRALETIHKKLKIIREKR